MRRWGHRLRAADTTDAEAEQTCCAEDAPLTKARSRRYIPVGYPTKESWKRNVTRSTVFTTNRSQAVRLPKPVALPPNVRQVEITKLGRSRLISPVDQSWDSFFDGPKVSEDFMMQRHQPAAKERELL